jgi:hypothetical protein
MVDIHNFLNEEAWNEVLKWEALRNWWVSIGWSWRLGESNRLADILLCF